MFDYRKASQERAIRFGRIWICTVVGTAATGFGGLATVIAAKKRVKTSMIKPLSLSFLILLATNSYAACVRPVIDEQAVVELPEDITVATVTEAFGRGCFGGMTAVTYQYKLTDG